MALVVNDRVKETSSTTGTGTFTLDGALSGFETFSSAIGNTNTTYYCIVNANGEFEVGLGTVGAGTLARDTILSSSNSDAAVNFSAGTKTVFCTQPAGKALYTDANNNAIALGTPASVTLTNATGLPIATGVSGLGTNVATFLGTPSSANLAAAVTNETGSGALVFGTSPTLTTPRIANAGFIADNNGNEQIKFTTTASAVNEISVTNAATGNGPEISATGSNTDIDLKLTPKGAGKLNLDGIKFPNADGTANQFLKTNGSGILSFATAGLAWQSVKTANFTAVKGEAYPVNTTSASITVTLPATPSAGDQVQLVDYAGTFDTNKLIIDGNGEDIEGSALDAQLTGEREGVILTYIDSTQGWIATSGINEGTDALEPLTYLVDFLVIAGGGGGGGDTAAGYGGGGGGAGGYRNSFSTEQSGGGGSSEASLTFITGTVYTITVGGGGAASTTSANGTSGSISRISGTGISTITSTGGGGGGAGAGSPGSALVGSTGGSGGGGGAGALAGAAGGSGTANQGFGGGLGRTGIPDPGIQAGGGGGASQVGGGGGPSVGGAGGNGLASSITGSSVLRAGGGGGSTFNQTVGPGGTGGGGTGAKSSPSTAGTSGTVNTGSGGGGRNNPGAGGAGGKGVVILRMPTASYSGTTTGSPTVGTSGTNTILTFNDSGSYTG